MENRFHQRSGKIGTKNAIKKFGKYVSEFLRKIFIYYIYVGSTIGTAAVTAAASVPRAIYKKRYKKESFKRHVLLYPVLYVEEIGMNLCSYNNHKNED